MTTLRNGLVLTNALTENGIPVEPLRPGFAGFFELRLANARPFGMLSFGDCNVVRKFLQDGVSGFEPFSLRIWASLAKQAALAIDIGAYTGIYSLLAAAINPNSLTIAFEPNPAAFSRLTTNILANQFDGNIAPVDMGVSIRSGHLDLSLFGGIYTMASGETFEPSRSMNAYAKRRVDTITGDEIIIGWKNFYPHELTLSLGERQVALIKIDVEGHEKATLSGLERCIRRDRPAMIVEILTEADLQGIVTMLPEYEGCWIDERGAFSRRQEEGSLNALLLPMEKTDLKTYLEAAVGATLPA